VIAIAIAVPLLGWAGLLVIGVSTLLGLLMERVRNSVFGGVSGDIIVATNESVRAVTLVLLADVLTL
jgi:cobalamin synthase